MRYVALLLIGLFIGSLGAVAAMSALNKGTPYNDAIMSVMKHQMGALHGMQESGKCETGEVARRFAFMAAAAAEIDAAFLPVGDDDKFRELSGNLNDAIGQAYAAMPATCPEVKQAMEDVGQHCKGCHDAFR